MAISSTDCRARVAAGQPVWYLVPDGVVQYIAKRQLYRVDCRSVRAMAAGPVPPACETLGRIRHGRPRETGDRHPSVRSSWR